MPAFELWGASTAPFLGSPQRPLVGYGLLLLYVLALILVIVRQRAHLAGLRRKRSWLVVAALAFAAFLLSQALLLPITTPNQLAPLEAAENPAATTALLGAVPLLAAAIFTNPAGALLVGLAGGLGRALWQTHQLLTPLHWALAGWLLGWLCGQNFSGRLWRWLRRPLVAGPLALMFLVPAIALAAYADTPRTASSLPALDFALSTALSHIGSLLIEGLLAGTFVALAMMGLGGLLPARPETIASPLHRSLRWQLLGTFTTSALVLTFLLLVLVYNRSVESARDLVINQMSYSAATVSEHVPEFLTQRQNLLREYSQAEGLLFGQPDDQAELLRIMFRSADFYRRVLLVDAGNVVQASYPPTPEAISLTELERAAVAEVLRSNSLGTSNAYMSEVDGYAVSFVAPIGKPGAAPTGALIGRTPDVSLNELIVGLQGTMGEGTGFLVDGLGQIIAHPDPGYLLQRWEPPAGNPKELTSDVPGVRAYEGRAGTSNARQLVAYAPGLTHRWTVVIQVPYAVVLELAMRISTPLMGVLVAAMTVFGVALTFVSRNLTRPLSQLVQVTQDIAAGNMETPITIAREDEIGQLSLSFSRMQRSLQKRLDELALLLNVSQDVSASIDIKTSMPAILQGAIRGTGAAGVRIVVRNPSGSRPLLFGEGPAAEAMARFDRPLMTLCQRTGELILATPRDVAEQLQAEADGQLPVRAIVAFPLHHSNRYLGVMWLGYRQGHQPDRTELDLLRTLSGQTAMLVVNGHLYANAEGGRRRLAAVLASTTDAVIVTDQADRILFINPAMTRAFGLPNGNVINQPVRRIVQHEALLEAITGPIARARGLEIPGPDDRVWSANPSNVLSQEGQVLGRVITLHDVTSFKEVDKLKSVFIETVSHDLRTPLAFMQGYMDMLPIVGALNEDQQLYTDRIKRGIGDMTALVSDLLDLNQLEGDVDLVREPINIVSLLRDLAVGYEFPARDAGLTMRLSVPASLPTVNGDARFLQQAVVNLITNAIKYAPNSGDLVLSGRLSDDGSEILVSMQDHGPGIPKEHQLRLFEKFYRGEKRKNPSVKGSGLGLAIVRSTAERHGGRAYCESEEGEGSTFTIALPVRRANAHDQPVTNP